MDGSLDFDQALDSAIDQALVRGERLLPDRLALAVAREIGLTIPHSIEVEEPGQAADLDLTQFRGDRLVVKLVAPNVAHKSDLGGVRFCSKDAGTLEQTINSLRRDIGEQASIEGYSVTEFVDHGTSPGEELLLGVRWTDDFGPVAAVGLGGVEVERLAGDGALAPALISSAARSGATGLLPTEHRLVRFLTEPYRGRPAYFELAALEELVGGLLRFAERWMSADRSRRISEFEFNPVVMGTTGPTALDALIRVRRGAIAVAPPRPLDKLRSLLEPTSIAVAGVSRRMNIGRTILGNILRQGFERERLWVIKEGTREIDGCRCFASFADLPEPVDLAVLAVSASQLPELVSDIAVHGRARSLILIPGGVGELAGSESLAEELEAAIGKARMRDDGGPVINGGNCLGIRSLPGHYDTLFIPGHKLAFQERNEAPLALLSQSGAFAVARASKLARLNPRYVVTFGNQADLTLADYLSFLAEDPAVSVFACYVEGFRPLDGRRVLEAVRSITDSGRTVILYRAGRSLEGARAAASHTASVAGSYRVTQELAARSGALMAETIQDLEDLVQTFCGLAGRRAAGTRLGAISNAGFETVAVGDNLNGLELAALTRPTRGRIEELFREARVESIVAVGNPLDVTPVLGDQAFAAATAEVLADENVDVGLVGCVPLTGALQTLVAGDGHNEDLDLPDSVACRLIDLWKTGAKPWVAVVDGGPIYDALARKLEGAGIPTFRSVDGALMALSRWVLSQNSAT